MAKKKYNIHSKNKNLRLCIIENSIYIEELISRTIGTILRIEWEESKSFGFGSSSMSFNQKVQIIQDIKGIDKEIIKKFTCLLNIRNKFAHVLSISTFEELFSLTRNGNEIKNALKKWYINEGHTDLEKEYRYYFYFLVEELIESLFNLSNKHNYDVGFENGKNRAHKELLNSLIEEVEKLENGTTIINKALNKLN